MAIKRKNASVNNHRVDTSMNDNIRKRKDPGKEYRRMMVFMLVAMIAIGFKLMDVGMLQQQQQPQPQQTPPPQGSQQTTITPRKKIKTSNQLENVLTWAKNNNYWVNPKIGFDYEIDENDVLNVFATHHEPLDADEVLIEVPFEDLLTPETAINDAPNLHKDLKDLLVNTIGDSRGFGDQMQLAAYISLVQKTKKGKFAGYVLNLPKFEQLQMSPMFYENATMFKPFGPPIESFALRIQHAAGHFYEEFPEWFTSMTSAEEFKFNFYLVTTRAFTVYTPHQTIALIALADYLNNHGSHDVYQMRDEENPKNHDGIYRFTSRYEYPEEQGELFGQYGAHANAEYAIQYGFFMDDNPWEYFYIQTGPGEDDYKRMGKNCYFELGSNKKQRVSNKELDDTIHKYKSSTHLITNDFIRGLYKYQIRELEKCKT